MDNMKNNQSSAPLPPDFNIPREIPYAPIGIIHSPFKELSGIPQQPEMGYDVEGMVEIFEDYVDGLEHLDKFRFITLICHLHQSKKYDLKIKHAGEGESRGIFSTRAPHRPNPIGISVVRLIRVEGAKVFVRDLDILDGTPVLDIKPYKKGRQE